MKRITQAEFLADAERRFGPKARNWKFVCPACGTVQSVEQLRTAIMAAGGGPDDWQRYVGFSCIGRFTGAGDSGISAHRRGKPWGKGCNWTLGGLLHIHTLEVIMEDGHNRPTFDFADPLYHGPDLYVGPSEGINISTETKTKA